MSERDDNDRAALSRVVGRWDEVASRRNAAPLEGWMDHPLIFRELFQGRVSGEPQVNWLEGLMARAGVPKGGRWASLGCGAAGQEIEAGRLGLYQSLTAYDASPASLALARTAAEGAGLVNVSFETIDLDRFTLPAGAFDVVLVNMSLHHVRELRAALEAIRAALAPDGCLVLNEFVGARQFQFPDVQLEIVRALLAVLPERLRADSATGRMKREYLRMPLAHWEIADPSEAIRSDLILPEVDRLFTVEARADYGGSVLHLLLEHIVHNFDPDDEKDAALLRVLAAAEALLIDAGVLPNDFTALAARPRAEAREGAAPPAPHLVALRPLPPASELAEARASAEDARLAAEQERTLAATRGAELAAIRSSRGWKALQALRALVGRRW